MPHSFTFTPFFSACWLFWGNFFFFFSFIHFKCLSCAYKEGKNNTIKSQTCKHEKVLNAFFRHCITHRSHSIGCESSSFLKERNRQWIKNFFYYFYFSNFEIQYAWDRDRKRVIALASSSSSTLLCMMTNLLRTD